MSMMNTSSTNSICKMAQRKICLAHSGYKLIRMLQLEHIKKYFHQGTPNEVMAVNDCSLSVRESEFVVMIGSNGPGKSTLLNLIAGTCFPARRGFDFYW